MDPQACLFKLMQLVHAARKIPNNATERVDDNGAEIAHVFEDLATWLKSGGFVPMACGPIFGMAPVSVGYPGMSLHSVPRYVDKQIRHVRSMYSNWRYAIMVTDTQTDSCNTWVFHEYDHKGNSINCWYFTPLFTCPTCKRTDGHNSLHTVDRCSHCDHVEGGQLET